MRRRKFLASSVGLFAAAAATSLPALSAAGRPRVKITDVQVKRVRVIKELGSVAPPPGSRGPGRAYRVGGDTVTLIHTDAGLTGIAAGVSPAMLNTARERLRGADPLDVQQHARVLFNPGANGANVEIALWLKVLSARPHDRIGATCKISLQVRMMPRPCIGIRREQDSAERRQDDG